MNKEFKKYVTDELLLIANNVTGEYTDKQVQQAKLELICYIFFKFFTEAWTTR